MKLIDFAGFNYMIHYESFNYIVDKHKYRKTKRD